MEYKNIKSYCKTVLKNRWCKAVLVFLAIFGVSYSGSVFAGDLLDGVKGDLKSNFGNGSVFVNILYLICILSSGWSYIETGNIKLAAKILALSVFITFALGHFVFKTT